MRMHRNEKYLKAFGQNLRNIRKSKGITQESLAFDSGLNISQIARIERGVVNPTICTILLISNALGEPPRTLFDFPFSE
jgi:transcriptional regulator with XRE-family HTH domain